MPGHTPKERKKKKVIKKLVKKSAVKRKKITRAQLVELDELATGHEFRSYHRGALRALLDTLHDL